jgi:hypothetical protein
MKWMSMDWVPIASRLAYGETLCNLMEAARAIRVTLKVAEEAREVHRVKLEAQLYINTRLVVLSEMSVEERIAFELEEGRKNEDVFFLELVDQY